jgi:hypothetical protein
MNMPKVGEKIYIEGAMFLSHGGDDYNGGLATISKIELNEHLEEDHINYIFISVEEVPGRGFNYKILMKKQEELKERYDKLVAEPNPDNREEFNRWD